MMNKVTRYRGTGIGNKITVEPGYVYTNEKGLTFISDNKQKKQFYDKNNIDNTISVNNADIKAILTRLNILQDNLSSLKKTNTQVVSVDSVNVPTMNDTTKDFIISGQLNKNVSVTGKSVELKNVQIDVSAESNLAQTGNNALFLSAEQDVELKNSTIKMNKGTSSNCLKVIKTNSLIIKDMTFNGTTYNTIMTGQNTDTFIKNMLIDNCNFNEDCKHINIWFAGHADDAVLTISNCHFKTCEQFLCLSDYADTNNKLTVNIVNCVIDNYDDSYITNYGYNYAGFMFIESRNQTDYNTLVNKNPFGNGKVVINIDNLTVKGVKVTQDNFKLATGEKGQSLYYYCTKLSSNNGCIKYSDETKDLFPVITIK